LGKLVSSTEQLEQQAKLAQTIEPLGKSLDLISQLPTPTATTTTSKKPLDRSQPLLNPQEPFKIDSRWHNSTPGKSIEPQPKP
jgi:phospholipid/cholesterol/gamma-HCH transport system substrate-binding protein